VKVGMAALVGMGRENVDKERGGGDWEYDSCEGWGETGKKEKAEVAGSLRGRPIRRKEGK